MKPILASIILCGISFFGFGQKQQKKESVAIEIGFHDTDQVKAIEFDEGIKVPFKINVLGNFYPKSDDNISIDISSNLPELNQFIVKKSFVITQSQVLDTIEFKYKKSHLINLKSLLDSIYKRDGFFVLEIEGLKKKKIETEKENISISLGKKKLTIVLKEEKTLKAAQEYNFYLGTNFDFQDNAKADSFYSEIDVFLQNLFWRNSKGIAFGGIRGGIYKNNSSSTRPETTRDIITYNVIENTASNDTITLQQKRVNRTQKIRTSNLGFYTQIMLRVYNKQKDDIQFQLFVAPYFEVIQRTQTTSFDFEDLIVLDTIQVGRTSDDPRLNEALSLSRERTVNFYDHYFGAGAAMRYSSNSIEMFMNPVLGLGDSSIRRTNSIQPFGLFQFHLVWKKLGLKIHGEIRKFFGIQQDPQIVLNLSKSIDINTLLGSSKK